MPRKWGRTPFFDAAPAARATRIEVPGATAERAFFVRYGYVPLLLVGGNAASLWVIARGGLELALVGIVVAAIAVSFAAERVLPYSRDWNADHGDTGRDLAHAFVNETLAFASLATIPVLASAMPAHGIWPHDWPLAAQLLLAVLVADLGITLAHMASHHVEALWRLHAVHHSIRRMYGFNGLMKHPLHQTIETTAGVTPLLLAGMPADIGAALAVAVAIQLLLQHSNVGYRVGPLRRILALNEGHRFHHLGEPGVGDVNFGLFTLLWDHALGTYSFDPARRFSSDDLGIAKWPDYPRGYVAQLAEPFRR